MARDKATFEIKGGEKENYIGCTRCIHEEDSVEICRLRLCVHAFSYFEDRYEPVEEKPDCRVCTHGDEEADGSNCYECIKGMANNFERKEGTE